MSGKQHGCLPYVIAIVSALSVGDPFLHEETLNNDDADNTDCNDELLDITNEKTEVKEVKRLRRRSFFQCQQVSRDYIHPWFS